MNPPETYARVYAEYLRTLDSSELRALSAKGEDAFCRKAWLILQSVMRAGGGSHYETLGVDANADREAIHAAWLRELKRWHPDRHKNSREATERTKQINIAYGVLNDPIARAKHDAEFQLGRQRQSPQSRYAAERAFIEELAAFAVSLLRNGAGCQEAARQLERYGCPRERARELIANATRNEPKRQATEFQEWLDTTEVNFTLLTRDLLESRRTPESVFQTLLHLGCPANYGKRIIVEEIKRRKAMFWRSAASRMAWVLVASGALYVAIAYAPQVIDQLTRESWQDYLGRRYKTSLLHTYGPWVVFVAVGLAGLYRRRRN